MKKAIQAILLIVMTGLVMTYRYQPVQLDVAIRSVKHVDIKGEVKKPGSYELERQATLQDLIQQAGGLTKQADTSQLNLSQSVLDQSVITIPAQQKQSQALISINQASEDELCQLTGIGPAMAKRIIDYRQAHPFNQLEQLQEVKGIGPKLFEKLKNQIRL